jgi:hypothetical protein
MRCGRPSLWRRTPDWSYLSIVPAAGGSIRDRDASRLSPVSLALATPRGFPLSGKERTKTVETHECFANYRRFKMIVAQHDCKMLMASPVGSRRSWELIGARRGSSCAATALGAPIHNWDAARLNGRRAVRSASPPVKVHPIVRARCWPRVLCRSETHTRRDPRLTQSPRRF